MEFKAVVKNRYSCKKYDSRQVEQEKLEAVLEAGRLAPTARNGQEQRIYVVQGAENMAKMDEVTPCRYGAPTVIIVAYDKNNVFVYPGGKKDSGAEDATIVATHMILAAANEELDSCWLNMFHEDKAKELFGIPENEDIVMLMDLGYAAEGAGPLAKHSERKELSETVTYIR